MRHGSIVEQGSVAEVFDQPQHEYTRALLAAHPQRLVEPVGAGANVVLQARKVGCTFVSPKGWFSRTFVRPMLNGCFHTVTPFSKIPLIVPLNFSGMFARTK